MPFFLTQTLVVLCKSSMISIRTGRVMPGVASPPLKFFFRNYPPPENFWIHLGPKTIPWDTFQAFQVYPATPGNCQVYPGVSKKKFFRPKAGKFFFDRVSRPPPEKFFSQKKIFFFTLISIHVRVRKIVSLQSKTSTFSL